MNKKAEEILRNVYISYNNGEDFLKTKAPLSSQIHEFNMAIKEIEKYIYFIERNMINIKIALTEEGLEYCMENIQI